MHPKKYALAASMFGGLLISSVASAQSADADRYNNHNTNNTQHGVTSTQHGMANNTTTHTGPVCPVGCVAAHPRVHNTAAARRSREDAMRRRAEREAMRQQEIQQARADQERQDMSRIDSERSRADNCERDLASARDRMSRDDAERAERERLERERLAAMQAPVPAPRGGGPVGMHRVYFGAEGGVAGFVGPMHDQVYPGAAWGAHVGWQATPWFGLEGRYLGTYHDGYNPAVGDGPGLVATAGSGVARFTIPTRFVQPYLFGGLGVVHYSVTGTNDTQTSSLRNRTMAYAPSGIGVNIPVSNHWAVTGEASYNWLIGASEENPAHTTSTVDLDNGFYTTTVGLRTIW